MRVSPSAFNFGLADMIGLSIKTSGAKGRIDRGKRLTLLCDEESIERWIRYRVEASRIKMRIALMGLSHEDRIAILLMQPGATLRSTYLFRKTK
jgi:hypothetical protein